MSSRCLGDLILTNSPESFWQHYGTCFETDTIPELVLQRAGANVMLINGLPVDVPSLELYELLDRISAEVTSSTCAACALNVFSYRACPTVG